MPISLMPRFNYSLPFLRYLRYGKTELFPTINGILLHDIGRHINTNNARTSLRILLSSIGKKQLRVGIQAYTCETVFLAIKKAGHQAVFIDVTRELIMDKEDLKRKAGVIDILIVTHTFGFPDELDEIRNIIGNKIIIEDCSHSYLSKYKEKFTGQLADAAIFSTGLAKFPPIGSGGFCVINDISKFPILESEYLKLGSPGYLSSLTSFFKILLLSVLMKSPLYGLLTYKIGKKLDKKLDFTNKHNFPQYLAYKWSTVAFYSNQSFFTKMLKKQRENALLLYSLIENKSLLISPRIDSEPNDFIFPVFAENREELYNLLLKNKIEPGKHFSKCLDWASDAGYKRGECKNTEMIVKTILTVPCHYGVSKKNIYKIAGIINNYAVAAG